MDSKLPPELLLEVVEHADRPTVAAVALVSRQLHAIATQKLYQVVEMETDFDDLAVETFNKEGWKGEVAAPLFSLRRLAIRARDDWLRTTKEDFSFLISTSLDTLNYLSLTDSSCPKELDLSGLTALSHLEITVNTDVSPPLDLDAVIPRIKHCRQLLSLSVLSQEADVYAVPQLATVGTFLDRLPASLVSLRIEIRWDPVEGTGTFIDGGGSLRVIPYLEWIVATHLQDLSWCPALRRMAMWCEEGEAWEALKTARAPPKVQPPVILPQELLDLVASIGRRTRDLDEFQLPQLAACTGPLSLHEQLGSDVRSEIAGIKRDLEELKLQVDDLDKARDRRAGIGHVEKVQTTLTSLTQAYRDAVLASKREMDAIAAMSPRDQLFLSTSSSKGRAPKTETFASPDDALMSATADVTEGLRRTMQLMQQELDKSLVSNEILEASTATMQMTSDQYSTFSTLLETSKALIKTLEQADFLDRLIILFAFIFFGLCCAFIIKRRILDKGLRVAGALTRAVARGGSGAKQELQKSVEDLAEPIATLASAATVVVSSIVAGATASPSVVKEDVPPPPPRQQRGRHGHGHAHPHRREEPRPEVDQILDNMGHPDQQAPPVAAPANAPSEDFEAPEPSTSWQHEQPSSVPTQDPEAAEDEEPTLVPTPTPQHERAGRRTHVVLNSPEDDVPPAAEAPEEEEESQAEAVEEEDFFDASEPEPDITSPPENDFVDESTMDESYAGTVHASPTDAVGEEEVEDVPTPAPTPSPEEEELSVGVEEAVEGEVDVPEPEAVVSEFEEPVATAVPVESDEAGAGEPAVVESDVVEEDQDVEVVMDAAGVVFAPRVHPTHPLRSVDEHVEEGQDQKVVDEHLDETAASEEEPEFIPVMDEAGVIFAPNPLYTPHSSSNEPEPTQSPSTPVEEASDVAEEEEEEPEFIPIMDAAGVVLAPNPAYTSHPPSEEPEPTPSPETYEDSFEEEESVEESVEPEQRDEEWVFEPVEVEVEDEEKEEEEVHEREHEHEPDAHGWEEPFLDFGQGQVVMPYTNDTLQHEVFEPESTIPKASETVEEEVEPECTHEEAEEATVTPVEDEEEEKIFTPQPLRPAHPYPGDPQAAIDDNAVPSETEAATPVEDEVPPPPPVEEEGPAVDDIEEDEEAAEDDVFTPAPLRPAHAYPTDAQQYIDDNLVPTSTPELEAEAEQEQEDKLEAEAEAELEAEVAEGEYEEEDNGDDASRVEEELVEEPLESSSELVKEELEPVDDDDSLEESTSPVDQPDADDIVFTPASDADADADSIEVDAQDDANADSTPAEGEETVEDALGDDEEFVEEDEEPVVELEELPVVENEEHAKITEPIEDPQLEEEEEEDDEAEEEEEVVTPLPPTEEYEIEEALHAAAAEEGKAIDGMASLEDEFPQEEIHEAIGVEDGVLPPEDDESPLHVEDVASEEDDEEEEEDVIVVEPVDLSADGEDEEDEVDGEDLSVEELAALDTEELEEEEDHALEREEHARDEL
ncbi:Sec20 family protein [Pseudohyphozyma bogoriensis]|nr:Sec20 family protein [Pseudohyphozyma bogoriensis]